MGSIEGGEKKAFGWAARDPSGVLSPYSYTLRFYFLFFYEKTMILNYMV